MEEEAEMDELQAEPTPTPTFPVQHSTLPPEHASTAPQLRGAPTHEERLEHLRLKYPHRYARRHEPRREEWIGATPFPGLDSWMFTGAMMISLIRSFLRLITFHTVLVTGLAVGSTLMCHYLDLTTDMPISLLASAIIFPISFGINYAFQRRERCFMTMASLKSSAIALYQCHREWDSEATWQEERRSQEERARQEMIDARGRELESAVPQEGGEERGGGSHELVERKADEDEPSGSDARPSTIERRQREERRMAAEVKEDIIRLFKEIKLYLTHKGGLESLFRIYTLFDELWVKQEDLRKRHEWVRSVISRPAQYHRYMMNDFENLKLIHDFRTASTLRGYGFVFLTIAPVLLGPYFAYYGDTYGLWAGVYISVFSSALLLTLYKIQEYVEDPFGGPDGINAEMMLEVGHHMF